MIKHINAYDVDLLNYRSFMFLFDKSISLFTYLFIRGGGRGGYDAGFIVIELRYQMIIQHILFPF